MIHRLALLLVLCCVPGGCAGVTTIRLMTYNIHHGQGTDGKLDLLRIAALIRSHDIDIVALNEVDRGVRRTDGRDLAAELAELCGMTAVFERNIDFQGGEYGNALLSRFPVTWQRNHHYTMLRPGEQRGLLQVGVDLGGRELRVLVTHLDHRADDAERVSCVVEIQKIADSVRGVPTVLCGDFNDTPGSRTHTALVTRLVDSWAVLQQGPGFTYPSTEPRKRIDYVFLQHTEALRALRVAVPDSIASDHLPLVVEIAVEAPR